ncbi:MAG: hypothetical protein ACOC1F_01820 [Myxococcota bacterium]
MTVSRTVSRGALDRRGQHVPVFDQLRAQVAAAEQGGITHRTLASDVAGVVDGATVTTDPLVLRLAWVVVVHAPQYDPVLVVTLPFCLESIVEGYGTMDDLFDHVESAEPVGGAPVLPPDLPYRSAERLGREVQDAIMIQRNDPQMLDRIMDHIAQDDGEPGSLPCVPLELDWVADGAQGASLVQRLPAAVRKAVLSVLEIDPAPGAVPLMQEIAGRLDAQGVRRLAGELVHVSNDEAGLRDRVRAAASLLAMQRSGMLDSL